jgi:hypothetical protein
MDRQSELIRTRNVRRRMSFRLTLWAGASMVAALIAFVALPSIPPGASRAIVQAIAAQFLLWGLIDAGLALYGLKQAQTADRSPLNALTIDRELLDRDKLLRVLRFSAKLDVAWVGTGILLIAVGAGIRNAPLIGHGIGVLVQGGFLMWFDRVFLRSLTPGAGASSLSGQT